MTNKTFVGINGLGRIGKCVFLQLLEHPRFQVRAINILNFQIHQLETYLKYDSIHSKYNNQFSFEIINDNTIKINNQKITLLNEKEANNLNWQSFNIHYVIDATGCYLTTEKALKHNVKHVILSAPPKDNTPMFVYGVNQNEYNGESIISTASCTTNCITPLLKLIQEHFGIISGNFTTIHASTSSQSIIDNTPKNNRINRSIYNAIIPHTTGASKSIDIIIPSLKGKIKGTSLRIPVSNVSIIDCNLKLITPTNLDNIFSTLSNYKHIELNHQKLISSDFLTTTNPTIVDTDACMQLGQNEFKLMVWYDNEWSYSAQLIKMTEHILHYNSNLYLKEKYFIENGNFAEKRVLLRTDYNIPVIKKNDKTYIQDTYRIDISKKTIDHILNQNPKYLILTTHFRRPNGFNKEYSVEFLVEYLQKLLKKEVKFLGNGFSLNTLQELQQQQSNNGTIYLMENVRFIKYEIEYNEQYTKFINEFCDVYVNDAFGCCHRAHSSIIGFQRKERYYGYVIRREIDILNEVFNVNHKTLVIIGGSKIETKLTLLKQLCKKVDTIYICGGNVNAILKDSIYTEFLEEISSYKAEIVLTEDGYKSTGIDDLYNIKYSNELNDYEYFFDCGYRSIETLSKLIQSHNTIFWNGALGVIEKENFVKGTTKLVHILNEYADCKKIIIAGGDSVGFVNNIIYNNKMIMCSGGGASIGYLSNGNLVGLNQFN